MFLTQDSVAVSRMGGHHAFPVHLPRVTIGNEFKQTSLVSIDSHPSHQVWLDENGEPYLYCYTADRRHWFAWPGVAVYALDPETSRVDVYPEQDVNRRIILDTYWRYILPIIGHVLGGESLHASAVAGPDGVIIFCGRTMSGKSTISYGLSLRGYDLWADDSIALQINDCAVSAVPIPFAMKLRCSALSYFGMETQKAPDWPDIGQTDPVEVGALAPPAQIFLLERKPHIAGRNDLEIHALQPHEAFTKLLTHARCFNLKDQSRRLQMMRNYLNLLNRVPVALLRFEAGLSRLPGILDRIAILIRKGVEITASGK
jgi:hypothetical protein